eukprot:CAMPEP_0172086086 /NCGR_PEP_ID=MMETSP1043-20130122/21913_1 /TAXON_ID=464988 /ORGANISM="Hemiselmis andersenii, Strain CCMP441" /LENGTH=55 /DNA_ID=CAMNT_0012748101 /DNA_START=11 /DNA_END=174 /DNA_ORIENTATION=-
MSILTITSPPSSVPERASRTTRLRLTEGTLIGVRDASGCRGMTVDDSPVSESLRS